jgi:hypothetical protein
MDATYNKTQRISDSFIGQNNFEKWTTSHQQDPSNYATKIVTPASFVASVNSYSRSTPVQRHGGGQYRVDESGGQGPPEPTTMQPASPMAAALLKP